MIHSIRLRHAARVLAALLVTGWCVAAAANPATPGAGGPTAAPSPPTSRLVNLNFTEAPVADVATALSIQSGHNILLGPSVKGAITARMLQVPLAEALEKVASAVGAEVRRFGEVYYVGSRDELRSVAAATGVHRIWEPKHAKGEHLKALVEASFPYVTVTTAPPNFLVFRGTKEDVEAALALATRADVAPEVLPDPIVTQTVALKHAEADGLIAQAKQAFPTLQFSPVGTSVLLRGPKPEVELAAKLISELDVEGPAQTAVRLYTLKYLHPLQAARALTNAIKGLTVTAAPESYGPRRATLRTQGTDAAAVVGQSSSSQSSQAQDPAEQELSQMGYKARHIILSGPPELVSAAVQLLEQVDVPPRQVIIEARVLDVSPEAFRELGFQFNWSSIPFKIPGSSAALDPDANVDSAGQIGKILRGAFNFDVFLNAMEQRRIAKLLANPRLLVLDNEEASFFSGDMLRFRVLANVSQGGLQEFTVREVPVGIALTVRPRVNTEGDITLQVHSMVSTVTALVGPERIPQTASREADTYVRVKDGETIVMGGLIREEEIRTMSKIPGLGDLPVLGNLFRNNRRDRRKSEITVFLTVRLVQ